MFTLPSTGGVVNLACSRTKELRFNGNGKLIFKQRYALAA
jgi:hypothetical protein